MTSINRFLDVKINYKYLTTLREINTILGQQQIQNILERLNVENTERKKKRYNSQKMKNVNKCIQWCIKNSYHIINSRKCVYAKKYVRFKLKIKIC